MGYENFTAIQMADELERIQTVEPERNTFTQLETATFLWTIVYSELRADQRKFANARTKLGSHRRDEKSLEEFRNAAKRLADRMRNLKSAKLKFCQAIRGKKTCGSPLLVDGTCPYESEHKH